MHVHIGNFIIYNSAVHRTYVRQHCMGTCSCDVSNLRILCSRTYVTH